MEIDHEQAENCKRIGNELYQNQEYTPAIHHYTQGIGHLDFDDVEHHPLLAILHGNISACFHSLKEYEKCIEMCDESLKYNPEYAKIRIRKVDTLLLQGDAVKAEEEIEKGELPPAKVAEVKHKAAEQREREKEEMLGKLKDLGNTVLGKFGMSLDNFAVNQTENGSYSINFNR